MWIRFLYNRSGEILTLLTCVAIGAYLVHSFSASQKILANEQAALDTVKEIYYLEKKARDTAGENQYLGLSKIKDRFSALPVLQACQKSKNLEPNEELFTDGQYLYYLRLEFKSHSASDYISGDTRARADKFRVLTWPLLFATTGERAYFVDHRGILAETANRHGVFDGTHTFPPDLQGAIELADRDGKRLLHTLWWMVDRL